MPLTGCLRIAVRRAALSDQFDTCLRDARAPTYPSPTDPRLALAAQRRQPGTASAGFRSDVKQLSGVNALLVLSEHVVGGRLGCWNAWRSGTRGGWGLPPPSFVTS